MGTTVNITQERIELSALDKGAKGVIDGVRGSVGNLRSGVDVLNGALAAVGVTLGAGAMIAFARDTLKATAALDDMAESTGASVEQLSAIRRVAQVGGHDFEGLTGQIAKTIKGLRESSEDGGRAAKAFEHLGVKTRDSQGRLRDMGEVVIEFAQKLDKYQDSGNKVALVQDALGRASERYIPLLKDIAEGTDLVATTTARQAAEADKAEKAMRRVSVAMEDNRRLLVNEYSPALTDFMEQMSLSIRLFGGVGSALYNIGFGIDPFKSLTENIRELNEEIAKAEGKRTAAAGGHFQGFLPSEDDIGVLRKRLEFLKFQQRQGANRLIGDDNLDARDLALRGQARAGKETLDYTSPSTSGGGAAAAVREAEFRAQKQVELEEMAAADSREAWAFYTQSRVEQDTALRKGQEQMMRDWFALIDDEQAQAIERGQVFLDSETNRNQEWLDQQLNMLIVAREQNLLTEEEFNERRIEIEIRHQGRLTGVTNTAYQQRQRFIKSSMLVQAQTIFGEMANITAGVAQHNKTLFQINKVAGIANAVIYAHEGAAKTMKMYGWPWGAVLAALYYAAAFAQVSAIRSTSFEGGGGGAAPSLAGSTAAQPVTPVPQTPAAPAGQQRGPQTNVTIVTRGSAMARAVAEEIAEGLNELHKDGFPMTFAVRAT